MAPLLAPLLKPRIAVGSGTAELATTSSSPALAAVNLAITPDQHPALVANSLDWVRDGENWEGVPDNKIYVIDLTASLPPISARSRPVSRLRAWRSIAPGPWLWSPTALRIR